MSTRSGVAIEREDGTFSQIYCHWDGYPSHNGRILLENYTDRNKIERLLRLGSVSILAEEIGDEQDFDAHPREHPEWCLAYHRDRGEEFERSEYGSFEEMIKDVPGSWMDYIYVFCLDSKWRYFSTVDELPKKLEDVAELTEEVCSED